MRSSVTAVLIAGVAAQLTSTPSLGALPISGSTASVGAPASVSFGTTASSLGLGSTTGATASSTSSVTAPQTRGIPIGTANGIQDSDVVCAQMGGQGAACGLPNVPSIYNPNPALRYQTQYSDNDLALLQSTNRYNANGQRIVNPTGNAALNLQTLDIPTQNAASSGVTTTLGNTAIQSTTTWLNNGALANYVTPSASNAVLPTSVAFQQANAAPWTTTPVNYLTGAGFGYSTALGATAGSLQTPVPSSTPITSYIPTTLGTSSYFPTTLGTSTYYPSTLGTPSYLPLGTTSFGSSYLGSSPYLSTSTLGTSPYLSTSTLGTSPYLSTSTLGAGYFPTTYAGYNPAAQPFTNAYSTPGRVGPPSQAGIASGF